MNGFVRHHEAFAEVSFGSGANLRRRVLDLTDDEASGVPAGGGRRVKGGRMEESGRTTQHSLLFNLLVGVTLLLGEESLDFEVDAARLEAEGTSENETDVQK